MKRPNVKLSIKSIEDLTISVNLASLLELAGWPKPGNVHRTQDFPDTRFEHFLTGIAAIQPSFKSLCEKIYQSSYKNDEDYRSIGLGFYYKSAAEEMMKWQGGGNVLLGHILVLVPLAAAGTLCLKQNKLKIEDFKNFLRKIIDESTVEDTLNLYEAIRTCNPGGLGKVEKYDINNVNSFREIRDDKINLKKIFEFSKEYDLISSEYSTGFSIILDEGLPYFLNTYNQFHNLNITTVNTYLKILSEHLDTLVIRKSGRDAAIYITKIAQSILHLGGISSEKGLKLAFKLDVELQEKSGNLNPGTTADLLAGIIFCALIFGLRI
ncbi:MAG: triphosphoribosyl-dephospho-CoA synthase [Promethearchaeota archaeon]